MIAIPYWVGMAVTILGWIIFRALSCLGAKKTDWKQEPKQLFFLINILVIVRFTFYPFSKVDGQVQPLLFDISTAWPFRINLIPFVNIANYEIKRELWLNLIGNFAMFIPTGIMTPLIYKRLNTFGRVLLTGFAMSLIIEIIQLPFAVRCSDVDDLILNTLGCIAGYGIYALARKLRRNGKRELFFGSSML